MPFIASIKTADIALIAFAIGMGMALTVGGGQVLDGETFIVYSLFLAIVSLAFTVMVLHRRFAIILTTERRRIEASQWEHYRQLEALLGVVTSVAPGHPLQETRKWAASPDFLRLVVHTISRKTPKLVIEAGSGVSTIVIGLCLRKLGAGRLISLDHDAHFAEQTKKQVSLHGLDDIVTVKHAPLVETVISGQTWRWYSVEPAAFDPIDLLVLDGPPSTTQPLARYPAVPLLSDRLKSGSVVLLDDGARPDEKAAVDRWVKEYPHASAQFVTLEKGAFVVSWGEAIGKVGG